MTRHGGAILAKSLENLGVTHAFGVPGESYLPLLDGLLDTSIRFVNCRNEGGAGFMAAAWGQLTGTPGVAMVTRGPGATNASIGVHTAMQGSLPMLLLIGQVDQDMQDREAFQEIDYRKFYGDVAKWVVEIRDVNRLPEQISRAWSVAMSGRKGPVVVALPADILFASASAPPLEKAPAIPAPAPAKDAMAAVRASLEAAKHPLIIYGGTSWSDTGRKALQAFAEARQIPVVAAFRAQADFDNHSPAYVGDCGIGPFPYIREAIAQSDLIVAINFRFGENSTDGYRLFDAPRSKAKLIHAHVSSDEINKIYQSDIAIESAPDAFCEALLALEIEANWGAWLAPLRAQFEAHSTPPHQDADVDMGAVMAHLQSALAPDAILTNGAGNFAFWPSRYFRFGAQNRLLAPQSGAMGYGLPAAIAAKIREPHRQVVCFAGDGDFQMNLQELGTAQAMGAEPIVLLLNNAAYGTIRMHQERAYKGRVSGTKLVNPDFVALASAYGFHAERVTRTADFAAAFARALASETGAVLELVTSVEHITPTSTLSSL